MLVYSTTLYKLHILYSFKWCNECEWFLWECCRGNHSLPVLKKRSSIGMEGLKKTTKIPSDYCRSESRDSKPGPPEQARSGTMVYRSSSHFATHFSYIHSVIVKMKFNVRMLHYLRVTWRRTGREHINYISNLLVDTKGLKRNVEASLPWMPALMAIISNATALEMLFSYVPLSYSTPAIDVC